jgi:hypothetical protein
MTREEEWAKLAEAATPGPWWADRAADAARLYGNETFDVESADCPVAVGGPVEDGGPYVGAMSEADARFVAAAREAVPALLAEVSQLRTKVDAIRKRLAFSPRSMSLGERSAYVRSGALPFVSMFIDIHGILADGAAIDDSSPFGPCDDPIPDPGQPSTCGPCGFDLAEHAAAALGVVGEEDT